MNTENKYPDTLAEARKVAQPILDMGAVSVNVKMSWGKTICVHRDGTYTDEEVY